MRISFKKDEYPWYITGVSTDSRGLIEPIDFQELIFEPVNFESYVVCDRESLIFA